VLGTAFMRDFLTTFDGTLGRITLSQKTSQTCKELLNTTEQSIVPSIISGVITLLVGLILGTKSLRGCLQFFDLSFTELVRHYLLCRKETQEEEAEEV
jgi:hypothetical protein